MNEENIKKIKEYSGDDKIISSRELLLLLLQKKESVKIKSGIPALDKALDGFEGGEITVVSGQTKQGKTLLCQSITYEMANDGIGVLWFSYEVQARQFLRQFGEPIPLFFLPQKLKSNLLPWVESKIYEGIVKYNIQVVFIDHLHFLVDIAKQNISLEIGAIMRGLKKLAIKYNICIFIICHTHKTKLDKEPDFDDLRDSSFISQESDNTLMIWRNRKKKETSDGEAYLKICLNRRQGVMDRKILLKKVNNFLVEVEDE